MSWVVCFLVAGALTCSPPGMPIAACHAWAAAKPGAWCALEYGV